MKHLLLLVSIVAAQVCLESTGDYNIRSSPCGTVVGTLANGEKTAYRPSGAATTCDLGGQSITFIPIDKNGGYVTSAGVKVCANSCLQVNTNSLNLRSSPCGSVVSALSQGTQKNVQSTDLTIATCSGKLYAWVNVEGGYAAADFLTGCGGSPNTPPSPPAPGGGCGGNQKPTAIGQNGLNLIKKFEGLYNCWYKDPVGYPTICYGHLIVAGDPYRQGTCLSNQQCEDLLRGEIGSYSSCVTKYITVPLNQNQFDALTSFVFNLGCGALQESTLRTLLNGGDYASVCPQLKRWVRAGGGVLQGLVNRRNAECDLFNSCDGVRVTSNSVSCPDADPCTSCLLSANNDAIFALFESMGRNTTCSQSNWKSLADEWCDKVNPWECFWKVPSAYTNATLAQCPMCPPRPIPTVPDTSAAPELNCTKNRGNLCLGTNCDVILQGSTCDPTTGNCVAPNAPKVNLPLCNPPALAPEGSSSSASAVAVSFLAVAAAAFM